MPVGRAEHGSVTETPQLSAVSSGISRTVRHFGPVVIGTSLAALGMHLSAFRSGVYEAVFAMWMGDSRVGDDL